MRNRCVLSGYYGFKNFGDEAILSVLVKKLKKDKHTITVISSDPEHTKKQYNHINSIYTFDLKAIIASIIKSNVLISGGGSLLQDVTSLKSLFYYLSIIFIALFFRKKVIIFAQGIGPIKNKIGLFLTIALLKHCKYVSVRDKKSFELLKSYGINADLQCDPIFMTKVEPVDIKDKTVAIQLRNCKDINTDFIQRLADSVIKNFPGYRYEIYSFQDVIDAKICEQFEHSLKMLDSDSNITLYKNLSNEQVIEQLNKVEYLIAMRFHAIIVGLLAGAKTLAINYDIKVEKIAEEFHLPLLNFKENQKEAFIELKKQDVEQYAQVIKAKEFDWACFESAMEWE